MVVVVWYVFLPLRTKNKRIIPQCIRGSVEIQQARTVPEVELMRDRCIGLMVDGQTGRYARSLGLA